MQTQHILQLSNNYTITFERGGGKMQVTVKEGDQKRATASGELSDYKRMFDLAVGQVPTPAGSDKPGPGPQSASKPFTGTAKADAEKAKTESSKK
jgi:hypothetical protein